MSKKKAYKNKVLCGNSMEKAGFEAKREKLKSKIQNDLAHFAFLYVVLSFAF
jgi:hypothetical protein